MTACVSDGRNQVVEEVVLVAEGCHHADALGDPEVLRLDALDEHRDAPALERDDELADHLGPCRIEDLQLRHANHDDLDVSQSGHSLEHPLRRAEEERTLEAEDGDTLVAGLGGAGELLAVHPTGRGELAQGEEAGREQPE